MIRFFPANAQNVGNRQNQQDAFGFSDFNDEPFAAHGGCLAIVCDGMGGLALGDQASRLAVKTFLDAYGVKPASETIPDALERSARLANAAVLELATSAGTPGEVGTTLVAAAFQPEGLHWISVGDSALFLLRDGQFLQVNTNHIYSNILDARAFRGEIAREVALADPQREALTSYVGARELREIDANVRPLPVRHGDVFALASDGLFKTLPQEQIVSTIAAGPESAAEQLVNRTIEAKRQYQDNVTVCTVRVVDPEVIASRKPPEATGELPAGSGGSRKYLAIFLLAAVVLACALAGVFLYFRHHPSGKALLP